VHDESSGHQHDPLAPLAYTLYTTRTELFVEFKPLVAGAESRFAAHFTSLGELDKAISEGSVQLSLTGPSGTQSIVAESPEVPGIFRLRMTPEKEGVYELIFAINTPAYKDTISIHNVRVYPDEHAAIYDQPAGEDPGNEITYLKEQAWKVDFATTTAEVRPFSEIIKTTGEIISSPGDAAELISQIDGIVSITGNKVVEGVSIRQGTALFTVRSNEVVREKLSADVKRAENDLAAAKANFDRASELVKDQIISQKEFQEARLRYENAQTALQSARTSRGFNASRQTISAPISGYLTDLNVENGQFVQEGQSLGLISKNQKLMLRADVSQKYFSKLSSVTNANFKSTDGSHVYSIKELNGRMVSFGKSASGSPFLPIHFEFDNRGDFVPGSIVEVYLQTGQTPSLVIPYSSLIEEQGIFYVYVQTGGESFQKREVTMGSNDGIWVQILKGLSAGERVVRKGAYQIKLSTATGQLPAHGHEH
jgi:RND family efflux transporter MFP subunit